MILFRTHAAFATTALAATVLVAAPAAGSDAAPFEQSADVCELSFDDVRPGRFYSDAVAWMVDTGVTEGTTATTFSPGAAVTRGEVATFLWRSAGEPSGGVASFDDVRPGRFYSDAVAWMVDTGVTEGTTATTFSPGTPVTRGEVATFLWRSAGEPSGGAASFDDVRPGRFYSDAVAWMVDTGVTEGTTATTFSPGTPVTRGEVATFLWRQAGRPASCTMLTGLASLGIDPLGRGDGIDLVNSDYEGRCYEDDTLEANRPMPPDPRLQAVRDLEEVAEASERAADAARAARDAARSAYLASFSTQATPPPPSQAAAGQAYLVAMALGADVAATAYERALVTFRPGVTWGELAAVEDTAVQQVVSAFFSIDESPLLVDVAIEVATEAVLRAMLDTLRDARDAALAALAAAQAQVTPGSSEPTADPAAAQAFEAAQAAYDVALAQSVEDGRAAMDAALNTYDAPSEYPPCDAEELRVFLKEAFCDGSFVNPMTPEDEAMAPGITARLDAYVARVCAAVA